MSATTLTLTIEPGVLDVCSSWTEFDSLAVAMSREIPLRALEETLGDAQERLIDSSPASTPLRACLARLGGPELGTGVLERVIRELNARTDIGRSRWSITGLRDLLTVHTARLLHLLAWKELKRATHRPSTIPFRLQKFNA